LRTKQFFRRIAPGNSGEGEEIHDGQYIQAATGRHIQAATGRRRRDELVVQNKIESLTADEFALHFELFTSTSRFRYVLSTLEEERNRDMRALCIVVSCSFLYLFLLTAVSALALDPSKRITQYQHKMSRVQGGLLPHAPYWISQTTDGYLQVGGDSSGFFRFDGVRFVPWPSSITPSESTISHSYLPRAWDFESATPMESAA
jgi:hypothetical protein